MQREKEGKNKQMRTRIDPESNNSLHSPRPAFILGPYSPLTCTVACVKCVRARVRVFVCASVCLFVCVCARVM